MTALLRRTDPWSVQPGWGIHVDLTPPELLNSRQITLVRKIIVSALIAVVVLCAGGYLLAVRQRSAAEDSLASAQDQTTALQHRAAKYAGVTEVEAMTKGINVQIGTLMKADVNLDALVRRIAAAEPDRLSVDQLTITISQAGVAGGAAQQPAGAIDNTGHPRIGTVSLTGRTTDLTVVSAFVDRLQRVPGLLDVVPVSNDTSGRTGQFNITFGLDDRLLSHRFDAQKGGN